jgi:hypothetical protein
MVQLFYCFVPPPQRTTALATFSLSCSFLLKIFAHFHLDNLGLTRQGMNQAVFRVTQFMVPDHRSSVRNWLFGGCAHAQPVYKHHQIYLLLLRLSLRLITFLQPCLAPPFLLLSIRKKKDHQYFPVLPPPRPRVCPHT